jgi:hypothetical protein
VPRLSVVVPATDTPSTLPACLAALDASVDPPDEVIVVTSPSHLSAAAARNAGAARATGDVVVFVDADVEVHPDALGRLRSHFARDDPPAAVFGSYDDRPAHPGIVSVFRNLLHHDTHQRAPGPADTFWSGLGAVGADELAAVGGFDDLRFRRASVEDIDLGMRVRARGGAIELDPAVQGTHLKAWTLRSMVTTDLLDRGAPWVALQVRHRRVASTLNLDHRCRASAAACVVGIAALAARRPVAAAVMLVALAVLNRRLYALVARRRGLPAAVVGVGLHAVHHLTAAASVPVGIGSAIIAGDHRGSADREAA